MPGSAPASGARAFRRELGIGGEATIAVLVVAGGGRVPGCWRGPATGAALARVKAVLTGAPAG